MAKNKKFLDLLNSFITVYLPTARGVSPNTIKSYKYAFQLLLKYLYEEKEIPADKITFSTLSFDNLTGFIEWLKSERKCSTSSCNQRISALSKFSKFVQNSNAPGAVEFRAAMTSMTPKRGPAPIRSYMTRDEIQILFSLPDQSTTLGKRDVTILSLMYATGARAQEICDLTYSRINFTDDGTKANITLIGKGNKGRTIKISEACTKIFKSYLNDKASTYTNSDYIFRSQQRGPLTIAGIEEIFKKYIALAKAKNPDLFKNKSYSPHSMRHTTATHMREAGVPLIVIKNFLGHSCLSTTEIYAKQVPGAEEEQIKKWNQKWFGNSEQTDSDTNQSSNEVDFLKV